MAVFTGTQINKLDKKGRVSVPASFRTQLADQEFQGIVVYRSFTAPALDGMDFVRLEQLAQSADELAAYSPEQEDISALIFADARQLSWDGEGRIMLPEDMIEHAGLSDSVAFVGKGRTFQLWEPVSLKASIEEIRKRAATNPPTLALRPKGGAS